MLGASLFRSSTTARTGALLYNTSSEADRERLNPQWAGVHKGYLGGDIIMDKKMETTIPLFLKTRGIRHSF